MPLPHPLDCQYTLPRDLSETSESSLSDNTLATMSPRYITADMTPDEIEIVSTYSGSQHGSSFSIESHPAADFARTKQFYSEADILSQDSSQKIALRRNSLPPEDNATVKTSNTKKRAKNLFKSILPRFVKVRSKEVDEDRCETNFPILDLSQEPALKTSGKCVYFYYSNVAMPVNIDSSPSAASIPIQICKVQPESDHDTATALESVDQHSSCTDTTSAYCSRSDLESGLGSNFSVNNTNSIDNLYHHCGKSVQRSQSMKNHCSVSQKSERNVQMKLSHHSPSLHSCERADSPGSSCYSDSYSGYSSLYSLGSSINYNAPLSEDLGHCHCEHRLKRNSITSAGGVAFAKSTRSHSFNGRYTIHRETQ